MPKLSQGLERKEIDEFAKAMKRRQLCEWEFGLAIVRFMSKEGKCAISELAGNMFVLPGDGWKLRESFSAFSRPVNGGGCYQLWPFCLRLEWF